MERCISLASVVTGMLVIGFVGGDMKPSRSEGLIVGTMIGAEYRGTSIVEAGGSSTTPGCMAGTVEDSRVEQSMPT